jgi:transcriptional regulator with XRE-family HTH domain
MATKRTFSDDLRRAIRRSGKSRYRIAEETGVSAAVLCHFMQGKRGMLLPSIDKLYVNLKLRLVAEGEVKPKRETKKGKR